MVDDYWDEIEKEITKAVIGVMEASMKDAKLPVAADQALSCLKYTSEKRVHSFTKSICLSGADVDLERVDEIVKGAASVKMLFISDELGKSLHHDIAAWDHLYQEWIYLESIPEKVDEIRPKG